MSGKRNTTRPGDKAMAFKVITLAIETLIKLSSDNGTNIEFQKSLSDAIKSLNNVKKHL